MANQAPATFREIKPNVYAADSQMKIGGTVIEIRTTALEIAPRQFVVISPLNPKRVDYESLKKRGEVVAFVAPNLFHHLFVGHVQNIFQDTKIWCAPGLEIKRQDINWDSVLTKDQWPYEQIEIVHIEGAPKFNEVVFYFKNAKTLVVTDLIFNLQKPLSFVQSLVFRIMGTYQRTAISRVFNFLKKDRLAVSKSLRRMMNFDFDCLIMAHGTLITENAKEIFAKAVSVHLI